MRVVETLVQAVAGPVSLADDGLVDTVLKLRPHIASYRIADVAALLVTFRLLRTLGSEFSTAWHFEDALSMFVANAPSVSIECGLARIECLRGDARQIMVHDELCTHLRRDLKQAESGFYLEPCRFADVRTWMPKSLAPFLDICEPSDD